MKRLILLIALGSYACNRAQQDQATAPMSPVADNLLDPRAPAGRTDAVVPLPKDQAQLDRMILAGYTPHSDHLHAPGVNECPMAKGTDAVM